MRFKGIVQRKLIVVKNKFKQYIFIRRLGAGQFLFYFNGTPSWILPKAFYRQLSLKFKNSLQILEGASNYMQHLLICFFIPSAPI
jgi:hypothetical protein